MACNGSLDSSSRHNPRFQFCVIGEDLKENKCFMRSIYKFYLPVVYSTNGLEGAQGEFTTIYIFEEFQGELFKSLHKAGQRILGPTTVIQYAEKNEPLPNNVRPLYTISMKNLVISFSGFRVKEELTAMLALVHHMGGSVRRDFIISKTTHLIATENSINGEKYKYALGMGIPIMTSDWVYAVWSRRHDASCNAADEEFMQYKLLPFVGCKIAFIGYKKDDEEHMIEISRKNGA